MSAIEIDLVLGWIRSTLASDSAMTSYAPGGVWLEYAPPGTATPFVSLAHSSGEDTFAFGAVRMFDESLYAIRVSGPASIAAQIMSAAKRMDPLLTISQKTAVTGGFILSSYCYQPVLVGSLVNGEEWLNCGGLYRVRAIGS